MVNTSAAQIKQITITPGVSNKKGDIELVVIFDNGSSKHYFNGFENIQKNIEDTINIWQSMPDSSNY